jgi:Ni/Co efflux regulator RcnB
MNKTLRNTCLALVLFGAGNLALAAPDHAHDHDRHARHDHGGHYDRHARYDHHHDGRNHYEHRSRWERGHRYHGPVYVVRDYGHYHLRRPPRGYHWIRGDAGDYLLVAVATGVILDIAMH